MSEKKVVSRSVVIALGIICIISIVGLGGAMAYYTMTINDKNTTYDNFASGHSHTNTEFNSLNTTYQDYLVTHSHTNSEYDSYVSSYSHTNSEYDSLQSAYDNYVANHHHTDSEYDSLQSTYNDYVSSHHHTDSEYNSLISQNANLQNQIYDLTAPKLVQVNLRSDDNRPFLATPYLHIYGNICNVGTNTAYNCKLHVVAYQSGGVVAIDTYVNLSNTNGESWTSVDSNIYYSGSSLTGWTINTQWTS